MPKIIDYSRGEEGESVGKIEDTGSFTTDDALLESILEDYVENGVETYLPEHTNNGVEYGIGVVESGNSGFARCVLQHLPSPYYGDPEEIFDLGDYSVKEVKTDKDDNPLAGKQGMDTVSHFAALSSESSAPSRERVDAEWNDIEDEENLPESAKMRKTRIYIDDRNEAPDWADVEEGRRGGTYYDVTRRPEGDNSAPHGMEYSKVENVESMADRDAMKEEGIAGGASADDMSFGFHAETGEKLYLQRSDSGMAGSDSEEKHITTKTAMDHADVRAPNMHFDEEEGMLVMEDIGENSNRPYKKGDGFDEIDRDSWIEACAAKFLAGDTDIGGNVLMDDNGDFFPIDFDLAGSKLSYKKRRINDPDSPSYDEDKTFGEYLAGKANQSYTSSMPEEEITPDEVEDALNTLVDRIDVDELEGAYDRSDHYDDTSGTSIMENIEEIKEGTLWE
jgi:hypothetical protein